MTLGVKDMVNANLLYFKTYYEKLGVLKDKDLNEDLNKKNRDLFDISFQKKDYSESPLKTLPGFAAFDMKTVYPGLLVGTGYSHGSNQPDTADEIETGFSFDYTNGQPVIPGSSVKGILRSCFRHPELIQACIPEALSGISTDALETELFEAGADVYLDAVIKRSEYKGHLLLGPDNITPHKAPTKHPVPIKMLKLLPDVVLEFRFVLSNSDIGGVRLTVEEKKKLFRELLMISGVGAKTNVGYGVLEPCSAEPSPAGTNTPTSAELSQICCPNCGKTNYKFKRNTNAINDSWAKKKCYFCKQALPIPD